MNPIDKLKAEIDAYLDASKMTATALGQAAMSNPNFIHRLNKGSQPRWDTQERMRKWMESNPVSEVAA